jgi:hypothetical protein
MIVIESTLLFLSQPSPARGAEEGKKTIQFGMPSMFSKIKGKRWLNVRLVLKTLGTLKLSA